MDNVFKLALLISARVLLLAWRRGTLAAQTTMVINKAAGKTAGILLSAAIIAAAFVGYIKWARNWDEPPAPATGSREWDIPYGDQAIHVIISCNCPDELTVGKTRYLQFAVHLKSKTSTSPVTRFQKIGFFYEGGDAAIEPTIAYWISDTGQLPSGSEVTFSVKVTPQNTNFSQIAFHFTAWNTTPEGKETGFPAQLGTVYWRMPAHSTSGRVIAPYVYALLIFALFAAVLYYVERRLEALKEKTDHRIAEAQLQANANPERAKFAWDLARVKLEAYFDRNLLQVNLVFWVAVCVMIVGFGFVLSGVALSYYEPKFWTTSLVAAVSGIITQFIGATFMVIYRSTMAQANDFMTILERINSVGMAVQVLDALPENTDLKNETRAALSKLLVGSKAGGHA